MSPIVPPWSWDRCFNAMLRTGLLVFILYALSYPMLTPDTRHIMLVIQFASPILVCTIGRTYSNVLWTTYFSIILSFCVLYEVYGALVSLCTLVQHTIIGSDLLRQFISVTLCKSDLASLCVAQKLQNFYFSSVLGIVAMICFTVDRLHLIDWFLAKEITD